MGLLQEETVSTQVCPETRDSAGRSLKLGREIWSVPCWHILKCQIASGCPGLTFTLEVFFDIYLSVLHSAWNQSKGAVTVQLKKISWAMTSVAQCLGRYSAKEKVIGLIPVRARVRVQVPFPVRMHMRQAIHVSPSHPCFSPSPSPSHPFYQTQKNIVFKNKFSWISQLDTLLFILLKGLWGVQLEKVVYLGDSEAQISRGKSSQENGHGTEKVTAKSFSVGLGGKYPHFSSCSKRGKIKALCRY